MNMIVQIKLSRLHRDISNLLKNEESAEFIRMAKAKAKKFLAERDFGYEDAVAAAEKARRAMGLPPLKMGEHYAKFLAHYLNIEVTRDPNSVVPMLYNLVMTYVSYFQDIAYKIFEGLPGADIIIKIFKEIKRLPKKLDVVYASKTLVFKALFVLGLGCLAVSLLQLLATDVEATIGRVADAIVQPFKDVILAFKRVADGFGKGSVSDVVFGSLDTLLRAIKAPFNVIFNVLSLAIDPGVMKIAFTGLTCIGVAILVIRREYDKI